MLTVADLGILREVSVEDGCVVATITPTYSGCPAMGEIGADVRRRLERAGYRDVEVRTRIAPPWSSEWITDAGRRKLTAAGIAPPAAAAPRACAIAASRLLTLPTAAPVACPRCTSTDTERVAQFAG
ncbi:MAG: phenylacetate-CoA oxygenase subunit PaaJ, partial [Jatrophihabitans sp.]